MSPISWTRIGHFCSSLGLLCQQISQSWPWIEKKLKRKEKLSGEQMAKRWVLYGSIAFSLLLRLLAKGPLHLATYGKWHMATAYGNAHIRIFRIYAHIHAYMRKYLVLAQFGATAWPALEFTHFSAYNLKLWKLSWRTKKDKSPILVYPGCGIVLSTIFLHIFSYCLIFPLFSVPDCQKWPRSTVSGHLAVGALIVMVVYYSI